VNVTPYFDYFSSDRSNNLNTYTIENYATGIILDYGVNSLVSVGGKLSYGEEHSSLEYINSANSSKSISKVMHDPEVYLSTRYSFETFRIYSNLIGHANIENHKTASVLDDGNMASGGSSADLEVASDITLGSITTGLLLGQSIWKDFRQVYDNNTFKKYELKGGNFQKYKVFFEINNLNNIKPGFIYSSRKTNPSLRLLDVTNQEIIFDYGQNDNIAEIYSRFRLDSSLVLIGSISQIDTVRNISEVNQEPYKTFGMNIGITFKY
jgi:hypothetical protein